MNKRIIEKIIRKDAALMGFTSKKLPEAGWYRIKKLLERGSLGSTLSFDEWEQLNAQLVEIPTKEVIHVCGEGGDSCDVLIFQDNSVYLQTNSQDEVWWDLDEFVRERIKDCTGDWVERLKQLQ